MYYLGFISNDEIDQSLIEIFQKYDFTLKRLNEADLNQKSFDFSGIIIKEDRQQSVNTTCEWIMKIKKISCTFVWVVSEVSDTMIKQIYLQMGADAVFDMVSLPEEFILFIRNSIYREEKGNKVSEKSTSNRIDENKKILSINQVNRSLMGLANDNTIKEVELTQREYQLMNLLCSEPGKVFSYEMIYKTIWGATYDHSQVSLIANVVFHIREKFKHASINVDFLKTVRSKGYMVPYK